MQNSPSGILSDHNLYFLPCFVCGHLVSFMCWRNGESHSEITRLTPGKQWRPQQNTVLFYALSFIHVILLLIFPLILSSPLLLSDSFLPPSSPPFFLPHQNRYLFSARSAVFLRATNQPTLSGELGSLPQLWPSVAVFEV